MKINPVLAQGVMFIAMWAVFVAVMCLLLPDAIGGDELAALSTDQRAEVVSRWGD